MIPVRSLRDLVQEQYYPDVFKVLVCCLLLNKCRGDTVRRVLDVLFSKFPTAEAMAEAQPGELSGILTPLGLQHQREKRLTQFAKAFLEGWEDVRELPGVGVYAADCYRIFFLEEIGDSPPDDGPLTDYWIAAKAGLWPDGGWPVSPEVAALRAKHDSLAGVKPKKRKVA